jgi:hypothetical protein
VPALRGNHTQPTYWTPSIGSPKAPSTGNSCGSTEGLATFFMLFAFAFLAFGGAALADLSAGLLAFARLAGAGLAFLAARLATFLALVLFFDFFVLDFFALLAMEAPLRSRRGVTQNQDISALLYARQWVVYHGPSLKAEGYIQPDTRPVAPLPPSLKPC